MKCIKITNFFVLLFISLLFGKAVFAEISSENHESIKLAILDNFHFQKNITNQFDQYYKPGIALAQKQAEKMRYKIDVKYFDYDRTPLGVLTAIPRLKAWNPDVIIGPRNSNVFLLIENQFNDVLVLSPFATANNVSSMPKNFYSLAFPDRVFSRTIVDYLQANYPKQNVFGLIESDCKNCVDVGDNFKQYYDEIHPENKITYNYFFQLEEGNINVKKILKGYKNQPIIFIPDNSAISSVLMPIIVNQVHNRRLFIGGDDWGTWKNTQIGKIQANYPYQGLRFTPWSFDYKTKKVKDFFDAYKKYFHTDPPDEASYVGYNAEMSFIIALHKYESLVKGTIKEKILNAYQLALEQDSNWFRSPYYFVYSVSPEAGSHLIGKIRPHTQ